MISFSLKNTAGNERALNLKSRSSREFVFEPVSQLLPATYQFSITAEDTYGNIKETSQSFIVDVSQIEITLKNPKFGASSIRTFDLEFETNQDSECRFSNIDVGSNFANFAGRFDITGEIAHVKKSYSDVKVQLPDEENLYVICQSAFAPTTIPQVFKLSFDDIAPKVLESKAIPNPVTEFPLETSLFIETDKETQCRYDCGSIIDFDSMPSSFGEAFTKNHSLKIAVIDKTPYSCNVACVSKASLESRSKIDFNVDSAIDGDLVIVKPSDGSAFSDKEIPLLITTSRTAQCGYVLDNGTAFNFPIVGREFRSVMSNLSIGNHSVEASCRLTQASKSRTSAFTIDNTPPFNLSVQDGTDSCGPSDMNLIFSAIDPETGIKEYEYQIKTKTGNDSLILNWTTSSARLTSVPAKLENGQVHIFNVRAVNKAGLKSQIAVSDGVLVDSGLARCNDKIAPVVTLSKIEEEGVTKVSINCNDLNGTGCHEVQYYGIHPVRTSCNPDIEYKNPVDIRENANFFCYKSQDKAGNIAQGVEQIFVRPLSVEVVLPPGDLTKDQINVTGPIIPGQLVHAKVPVWVYYLAAFLAVSAIAGGFLYYKHHEAEKKLAMQKEISRREEIAKARQFGEKLIEPVVKGKPSELKAPPVSLKAREEFAEEKYIDENKRLREIRGRRKEKIRESLFGKFLEEKGKLEKLSKEVPKKKAEPAVKEISEFDKLEGLLSKSKDFDKLISKVEGTIKKTEFDKLKSLADKKGVKVSRDDFDNLINFVSKRKKK